MVSVCESCCGFSIITGCATVSCLVPSSWLGHGSVGSREDGSIEGGTYRWFGRLTTPILSSEMSWLLSSDGGASVVAIA